MIMSNVVRRNAPAKNTVVLAGEIERVTHARACHKGGDRDACSHARSCASCKARRGAAKREAAASWARTHTATHTCLRHV